MAKRRYADAVEEYRSLANESNPAQKPAMQLALADALHRSGKNRDAKQVLTSLGAVSGEENPPRLYLIGQVAFTATHNDPFYRPVYAPRQSAPPSPSSRQSPLT